ncbi:MAG: hypothetical protein ACLP50_38010 [Solirubrobacteraceae bacterium]
MEQNRASGRSPSGIGPEHQVQVVTVSGAGAGVVFSRARELA